jgi:ribosome-associated toxin RatA of RatAB toxin-antitoxin module
MLMRTLRLAGTTRILSAEQIWDRISQVENYPQYVKFCRSVTAEMGESGPRYTDVTTLLWVPLSIEHEVVLSKPGEELHYYLPLPLGGKMWHVYRIKQQGDEAELQADIRFDLGNPIFNHTVGRVLKRRLEQMYMGVFPEMTNIRRLD